MISKLSNSNSKIPLGILKRRAVNKYEYIPYLKKRKDNIPHLCCKGPTSRGKASVEFARGGTPRVGPSARCKSSALSDLTGAGYQGELHWVPIFLCLETPRFIGRFASSQSILEMLALESIKRTPSGSKATI